MTSILIARKMLHDNFLIEDQSVNNITDLADEHMQQAMPKHFF